MSSSAGAGAGHRALVVEDDPEVAAQLARIVRSRGDDPRVVATVEEALAAIAEEPFCYFILDQQLPTSAGEEPVLGGGERLMETIRARDRRRKDGRWSVTPILAVTHYSEHADFVSKMFEHGADAFAGKPLDGKVEAVLGKIRTCLERGGRGEHGGCAALVLTPARGAGTVVRIALTATRMSRRTAFLVNGAPRDVADAVFHVLFRFVGAHLKTPGAWSSRDALGFASARDATTIIRRAFDGLLPEGFELIEADRSKNFRLNPAVVVEAVDWEALEDHPHDGVRKLAKELRAWVTRT